jgi:hypothetical protein
MNDRLMAFTLTYTPEGTELGGILQGVTKSDNFNVRACGVTPI